MNIIVLSTILFSLAMFLFAMGYHSVDLAYNNKYGILDINFFGVVKNRDQMYLMGLQAFITSTLFFIISYWLLLEYRIKKLKFERDK